MYMMNHSCLSYQYKSFLELPNFRRKLVVFYSISSLTAVSLNSLILYSIWKNPTLHKPSYLLLANLALTDFLFGAIGLTSAILTNYAYINKWRELYCYISASSHLIAYWLCSVSLYTLTLISVDRLLAIRLKNRYRSFVTSRRIWMTTIPAWVTVFLILLSLYITSTPSYVQGICASMGGAVLLVVITVCYSMAFYKLKNVSTSVSPSCQQQLENGRGNAEYRRSLNTMLLVMLTTLLLYLSYFCCVIIQMVRNSGRDKESYSLLVYKSLLISEVMTAGNSTVNPVLYLWRIRDIRQAVKTTLRCILRLQPHHSVQD